MGVVQRAYVANGWVIPLRWHRRFETVLLVEADDKLSDVERNVGWRYSIQSNNQGAIVEIFERVAIWRSNMAMCVRCLLQSRQFVL